MPTSIIHHIPCNLLTGFLGSGKTTLLRHVMEHGLKNERVAILMNEIGDVNIEGVVFDGLESVETMVELNSGCICCTIQEFLFESAYLEVLETARPTSVIIESTGLADPAAILGRLDQMGVRCDSVITVVDAANHLRLTSTEDVLAQQVRSADFLVINKTDLSSPQQMQHLRRHLRTVNTRALQVLACRGEVDAHLLFASGVRALREREAQPSSDKEAAHSHHHGLDDIQPLSYRTDAPMDLDAFEEFLSCLPSNVYRAKGIIKPLATQSPCIFNFTCGRYEITSLPALTNSQVATEVVFIGRGLTAENSVILPGIRACERPQRQPEAAKPA